MKKQILAIAFLVSAAVLSGCGHSMYQLIETSPAKASQMENNGTSYETSELKITYDFWADGGKVDFTIFNKTNSSIYLDWDKSHFILNGLSLEYWTDSEITNSLINSTSSGSSSSATSLLNLLSPSSYNTNTTRTYQGKRQVTVSASKIKPKRIIHIPSHSAIQMSSFAITKTLYYDCDLHLGNSSAKRAAGKSFTSSNTPLSFRNYLTYYTEPSAAKEIVIDNEFFVSKISFLSESSFLGKMQTNKECDINGKKTNAQVYSYPYRKQNNFYIQFANK